MVSPVERDVLEAVAYGRNSLDHFVDRLGLDCPTVRGAAESLVERGYLQRRRTRFGVELSYELTRQGEQVLGTTAERGLREVGMAATDLKLLRLLVDGPAARAALVAGQETALASQLSYLQDMGYVTITGLFRGSVAVTAKGRRLLEQWGAFADTRSKEGTIG